MRRRPPRDTTYINCGKVYDLNYTSSRGTHVGLSVKYLHLNSQGDALLGKRPFLTNIQRVYKITSKRKAAAVASGGGAAKQQRK